jgi:16S rRNA (uracil1498-N3)-methyltransferase
MLRLYYPLEEHPRAVHISGEKARYLATVLRCKAGEDIIIFDGRGASYKALLKSVAKREVIAEIIEAVNEKTESPLNVVLLQGLLKGEKMDLVVQKAVELGVKEIVPVITERSQVRETTKVERWRKIAEDASRQSGRSAVPHILEPISFSDVLSNFSPYAAHFKTFKCLIFWEEGGSGLAQIKESTKTPRGLMMAVGPEGGFTKNEAAEAESKGFVITSLGNRILRAETAAIAATAIVQFIFGDLGQAIHPHPKDVFQKY